MNYLKIQKRQRLHLTVVGMVDEDYGVSLRGDDVKLSDTISDLYNVVVNKTDE